VIQTGILRAHISISTTGKTSREENQAKLSEKIKEAGEINQKDLLKKRVYH